MARAKTYYILLSNEERNLLYDTINNKKTCKTIIRRCFILLELDENSKIHSTQIQIANSYGVSQATISHIAKSYMNGGINDIIKIRRNRNSNAKRKADDHMEEELIRIASGPAPEGRNRWSLRLLEKQIRLELNKSIGRESIRIMLKKRNFNIRS